MKYATHNELKLKLEAMSDFEFQRAHGEDEIQLAEVTLGVTLPNSFKSYLKEWGNVSFGHVEYLGLTNNADFFNASFPNFVWYNLRKREQEGLPSELIVFQSLNNEVYHCLDCSKKLEENECVITVWNNLDKTVEQELNIGFNNFLIGEVEEYIDMM
ncbi:SMI1/KNR4 family protein [Photobacterium alginatilyticum]|uniref:SMI1/KNR4 family protein n=1 Tax=Photobacterium alginatilyticum TaxID=1775171 RepID=UPI0040679018